MTTAAEPATGEPAVPGPRATAVPATAALPAGAARGVDPPMQPPAPSPPAGEPRKPVDVLKLVTSIGSPIALVSALMVYFGWVRSQAQAEELGAEVSVFAMSSQEYLLRSVNVVFWLLPLLLVALGLLRLHDRLSRSPGTGLASSRAVALMQHSWAVFLAGAVLSLVVLGARRGEAGHTVLPLWLVLAVAVPAYAAVLRRRPVSRVAVGLVVALLVGLLFLQVERLATVVGQTMAEEMKRDPGSLPAVRVLSTADLRLDGAYVTRTDLGADETSAYRWAYSGLYLLQRSGGKYFFLTDGWAQGQGRLLVLPDSAELRVEFGPAAR